ncbi:unnamed protein product [Caenorhabditis auriculariae]|uniref:Metaxin glutathione S-transferase domain-containing protein n=1 Tax=Caenorhabditis auriculariae TaxID=2777116 RepID=A0A8S1GNS2_9PELO|nr:unnamed protein product [Caenorhabditis auriculariae]
MSSVERAQSVAISSLLDELEWMVAFARGNNIEWIANDKGILENFGYLNLYIFRNYIVKKMRRKLKRRTRAYGLVGSTATDEVTYRTEVLLESLSALLGANTYFFPYNEPLWIDCKAFAVLAQFIYTPVNHDTRIKQFLRDRVPNLTNFVRRMKKTTSGPIGTSRVDDVEKKML